MRASLLTILMLATMLVCAGAHAQDAISCDEQLREIDTAYYYPATAGVKDMQADVETSLEQELARQYGEGEAIPPLDIKFYWEAPDKSGFAVNLVSGPPESATAAAFCRGVQGILSGRDDFLAPQPLQRVLVDYACVATEADDMVHLHGVANTPEPELRTFDILYDPLSLRIKRIQEEFRSGTMVIAPTYKSQGLMYMLVEQKRAYRDLVTQTHLEWEQHPEHRNVYVVKLMRSVTRSAVNPKVPPSAIILEFSNWKINEGLPAGVFDE